MNTNPKFSIIMPVYNVEKYLEDAVNSVLNQTFSDFELILIDDCSPDKSPEICDKLAKKDERIKAIHLQENKGASYARNKGIEITTGKYIYFMDSDDVIESDLFSVVNDNIEKYETQIVMFGFTEDYYDKNGLLYKNIKVVYPERILQNKVELRKEIIYIEKSTLFGYGCNKFYLAELIKNNNIKFVSMTLNEDFEFNHQVFKYVESFSSVEYTGYHYNKRNNGSLTSRFVPEYFDYQTMRVGCMLERYEQWDLCTDEVKSILGNIYVRSVFSALQRNCDKRSDLTYSQRKDWIRNLYNDKLYKQIVLFANPEDKIVKIMSILLKKKMTFTLLASGRIIYIVKENLPVLFSKVKQKK